MQHTYSQISQLAILETPESKVLLLQKPEGLWCLPGGRLHVDEPWEDGLRREVLEETGLDNFKIVSCLGVDNWVSRSSNIPRYGSFFHCRVDYEFIPQLSSEHKDFVWVSANSLPMYAFYRDAMKKAVSMICR